MSENMILNRDEVRTLEAATHILGERLENILSVHGATDGAAIIDRAVRALEEVLVADEDGLPVSRYEVRFVALGEGYQGDYDPTDPTDEELLRLDIECLDDPELSQSACTNVPADLRPGGQRIFLTHVRALLAANPDKPRAVSEVASWSDDRVCNVGFDADDLAMRGLDAPTGAHIAEAQNIRLDDETVGV